jgi:hypothetical protein
VHHQIKWKREPWWERERRKGRGKEEDFTRSKIGQYTSAACDVNMSRKKIGLSISKGPFGAVGAANRMEGQRKRSIAFRHG